MDIKGDGRGVTSPMAEMTGLGYVELAAEGEPKTPLRLVLRLGVLEMGLRLSEEAEGLRCNVREGRTEIRDGVTKPLVQSIPWDRREVLRWWA